MDYLTNIVSKIVLNANIVVAVVDDNWMPSQGYI